MSSCNNNNKSLNKAFMTSTYLNSLLVRKKNPNLKKANNKVTLKIF